MGMPSPMRGVMRGDGSEKYLFVAVPQLGNSFLFKLRTSSSMEMSQCPKPFLSHLVFPFRTVCSHVALKKKTVLRFTG